VERAVPARWFEKGETLGFFSYPKAGRAIPNPPRFQCAHIPRKQIWPNEKTPRIHHMTQSERALEDARQAGIDLDLLDTIQALSIAERWRQHDAAVNLATKLAEAKQAHDA